MPNREAPISAKLHAAINLMRTKTAEALGILELMRPLLKRRGPLSLAEADILNKAVAEATTLLLDADPDWYEVRHKERQEPVADVAPLFRR